MYRQAVRHSSAIPDDQPDLPDNERLEFLGDAVLDMVVGHHLFIRYTDKGEGFLTRMRSKLVSRQQLSFLAKQVGVDRVVESNVGRGHETSVPGNALEALIGAHFLDKGFDRTSKAVWKLLHEHLDLKTIEQEDRDSKSRLLEWGQKKRRRIEFHVVEESTRSGRGKTYLAEAKVDGVVKGSGRGPSKKKAEQDAAQAAFSSVQTGGARDGYRSDDARHARARKSEPRPRGRRSSSRPSEPPRPLQPPAPGVE